MDEWWKNNRGLEVVLILHVNITVTINNSNTEKFSLNSCEHSTDTSGVDVS